MLSTAITVLAKLTELFIAGKTAVRLSVCVCVKCVWILTRLPQIIAAAHRDL